jgi:hypothetical protein
MGHPSSRDHEGTNQGAIGSALLLGSIAMSYTLIFCTYTGSLLDRSYTPTGETRELFFNGHVAIGEQLDIDEKSYLIEGIVHNITKVETFLYVCEV